MESIKYWFNWFVTSSSDPLKFSLTVRGALMVAGGWVLKAAVIVCGLGIYCLGVSDEAVNQAVEIATNGAYGVALVLGAVMAAIGLIKKIKNGRWSAA